MQVKRKVKLYVRPAPQGDAATMSMVWERRKGELSKVELPERCLS